MERDLTWLFYKADAQSAWNCERGDLERHTKVYDKRVHPNEQAIQNLHDLQANRPLYPPGKAPKKPPVVIDTTDTILDAFGLGFDLGEHVEAFGDAQAVE